MIKNAFKKILRNDLICENGILFLSEDREGSKVLPSYQKCKKRRKLKLMLCFRRPTVSVLKRAIVIAPRNVIENMHIRGIHLPSYRMAFFILVFLLVVCGLWEWYFVGWMISLYRLKISSNYKH